MEHLSRHKSGTCGRMTVCTSLTVCCLVSLLVDEYLFGSYFDKARSRSQVL